jgi:predicted MFS family arabinose efflux permease
MLMDISSELVHSLLPMFLVSSLGASVATVGLIEGVAGATALIVKVFSGAISDYLGNRKWLAVAGYALGALSKPFFAIAPSAGLVGRNQGLLATMVADTAPVDLRGTAFGFFNLLSGVAMLAASTVAGLMWDGLGPAATFYAGALFSLITLVLLAARSPTVKAA